MNTEIFINIYNGPFTKYLLLSQDLGSEILEHSELVDNAYQTEIKFLEITYKFRQPFYYQDKDLLMEPIKKQITTVENFKHENEASTFLPHLFLISKSIHILEWIVKADPLEFIENLKTSLTNNKEDVLVNFQHLDNKHVEWLNAWSQTMDEIGEFVCKFHKNGLVWKGQNSLPSPILLGDIPFINRRFDHLALFQEITKSKSIIKILRQVNTRETTEELLQPDDVLAQNGNRWRIEHKKGDHNSLIIQTAQTDNIVYVYNCFDCTILIENTVKIIRMDSCKKVCIIFKAVLNNFEMADCKDIKIHVFSTIPMMKINTSTDVKIFLTIAALNVIIYTSQCNNINVLFPFNDGVHRTFRIPETLMTTISPNRGVQTSTLSDQTL